MKKRRKKGMTLLELIIVMAISTIIVGVMTTMFVSQSNILQKVDRDSILQLQAKDIETTLNKIAMESKGPDSEEEEFNTKLTLKDAVDETKRHIFEVMQRELIYYTEDDDGNQSSKKTIGRYVDRFSGTFNLNSLSYSVEFKLVQGGKTTVYTLENRIVFRNYEMRSEAMK